MKKILVTTVIAAALCVTTVVNAQISAEDIPDMGNLAKLIGDTDRSTVESSIYDDTGKIATGMIANDSARGETAMKVAEIMSDGDVDKQANIANGISALRVEFEKALTQANFAENDLGVGMAASFIMLWELASDRQLAVEDSFEVGKFLVHSFGTPETVQRYRALPEDAKAKLYDFLMTTPVAFAGLVELLENQNMYDEARTLREKSASLFIEIFKAPHELFTIASNGQFTVDEQYIRRYQQENGTSEDDGTFEKELEDKFEGMFEN